MNRRDEQALEEQLVKRLTSHQFNDGPCPECGESLSSVEVCGRRTAPTCTGCDERKIISNHLHKKREVCDRHDEDKSQRAEMAERKRASDDWDKKRKDINRSAK